VWFASRGAVGGRRTLVVVKRCCHPPLRNLRSLSLLHLRHLARLDQHRLRDLLDHNRQTRLLRQY